MNPPPYLLLDVGNSSLKAALLTQAQLGTVHTWPHPHTGQLSDWLGTLPRRPTHAVMVSVAQPAWRDAIERVLHAQGIVLAHWQHAPLPPGFVNRYEAPTLGADRLAGAIGACTLVDAAVLVLATFGTATTVDLVVRCHYHGGVIAPGVRMMLASLNQGTAQLPLELPLTQGAFVDVPANTHDALFTGMCAAQQGAVAHVCKAAQAHGTPHLVVSGGAAHVMAPYLPPHTLLPHTVLHGLAAIAPCMLPAP
jgi:type III pantothenate kinase